MVNEEKIAEAPLAGILQDMVLESTDAEQFLADLSRLAAGMLSTSDVEVYCGVSLLRPRKKGTVASSSERARQLDEIQYGYDDGPCLRAAREETVFQVEDVLRDGRFPGFEQAVAEQGVRSILSVPIPLDGPAKSALNLYAMQPGAFDGSSRDRAELLAREASKSLRLAVRIAHLSDSNADLKAAIQSRTTIDLATGIIMGQNRCSQDAAFKILKLASNARNIKLYDVAAAVVRSASEEPVETHFDD
ncbi:GAF and ANTAR domain-containing protein [Arthrobacter mobilis]|uniref:GAF and ANTAR domain-containing protein n=1 Tax=Arthrobacter mobilis TaxID=2724944 RepID=A0A7X6HEA1_9MICC|nr:GAF and ANTAR domain-containing protein [Arthrobacter mobilis]NKX55411.1 GAF and ANTAR domain-containing protein [Arthrobacter mobilis]